MVLYSAGDRVSQSQYGTGTVTVANDHHTVIEFDASATAAPPKPVKTRRRTAKAKS